MISLAVREEEDPEIRRNPETIAYEKVKIHYQRLAFGILRRNLFILFVGLENLEPNDEDDNALPSVEDQ